MIIDDISRWKVIGVHILLSVSIVLISLTKLWDMIIRLRMCKGHTGHMKVLDSKPSWLTTNHRDIVQPLTDKWECTIKIGDKYLKPNLSQQCYTSHRRSSQCATWICVNDHHHIASLHKSNCFTLHLDLVHMANILKIAHGRLWKSRRRNFIMQSEEVGRYQWKISELIYIWLIASWKHLDVTVLCYPSLREYVYQ